MTARALEVLAVVDWVAAEDTRVSGALLARYGLKVRFESYHHHNRAQKGEKLLRYLREGQSVALVADAGTPGISDPGADLVALCAQAGIPIAVVPGACAAIAGLIGSGLDTTRFVFEGFIPPTGKARRDVLAALAGEPRTMVLYEAPHRLERTLRDLSLAGLGVRHIAAGRELTKLHEEFLRATVDGLLACYQTDKPRGEYVLVLEGQAAYAARTEPARETDTAARTAAAAAPRIDLLAATGKSTREIADVIARELSVPRNLAYTLVVERRRARESAGEADPGP